MSSIKLGVMMKEPATEAQKRRLRRMEIAFDKGITKFQAHNIIKKHAIRSVKLCGDNYD